MNRIKRIRTIVEPFHGSGNVTRLVESLSRGAIACHGAQDCDDCQQRDSKGRPTVLLKQFILFHPFAVDKELKQIKHVIFCVSLF